MRISIYLTLALILVAGKCFAESASEDRSSAGSVPIQKIQSISDEIDRLVEAQLTAHDQKPNRLVDDATFQRRVYLDIIGRIPTYEEAKSFLASKDKDRRAKLIDRLLDSPGYVSHQYNFWADILRIKTRLQGGRPGQPYIEFVKDALSENRPYDEFVRELLTSEGHVLSPGGGATGYYLRDDGMPEDNMANTVRVFLGTRIECAQCHDHPFDKWTQRDFFEMVAFNGGMRTRSQPGGIGMSGGGSIRPNQIRKADVPNDVKQIAQNLLKPLSYGAFGKGTGLARLPDSYQYDDGEPNEILTAKTLFEDESIVHPTIPVARRTRRKPQRKRFANLIPGAKDINSRDVFADWMTSPDNPRFTLMIANRLWKNAMGLGLIEPVDDLTDESVASNEALLEYLTRQMIDLDYDMKQFSRAIFNSRTYQRESESVDIVDASTYHFPGPLLRRLSAEQLWDSFLVLAVPDLDGRVSVQNQLRDLSSEEVARIQQMSLEELLEFAGEKAELRKDPAKRRQMQREKMKSTYEPTSYDREAAATRAKIARLKKLLTQAKKRQNRRAVAAIQSRLKELNTSLKHIPTRINPGLVRASELQSPAPVGHFLREFGQSDRDQIENANSEPAVTQVLALMNGQIEKTIISNPRTVLMSNVVNASDLEGKIDTIYISMLSRKPTRSEKQMWLNASASEVDTTATDLIWTLANTSEFMFIQ